MIYSISVLNQPDDGDELFVMTTFQDKETCVRENKYICQKVGVVPNDKTRFLRNNTVPDIPQIVVSFYKSM